VPLLLVLDIAGLSLSLAVSTALVLLVGGGVVRRRLNRDFIMFALMETGWAAASLILRLSLWFDQGNPTLMLELATLFVAFMGPFLLLFIARYVRLRGNWPLWTTIGILVATLSSLAPLLRGMLVASPRLTGSGVLLYVITPFGVAGSMATALCMLFSLAMLWRRRAEVNEPFIAVSILFLIAGFLAGGIAQLPVPFMSFTNTVSVSMLGLGIMRRQLFNPLRELAADLRARSHRQELIAAIGRRTTALLELDELLLQAVATIRASFEYFTVGILLVEGDALVLRASTLPAIQAYSKKFSLKVGVEGICGWVAASGRPFLAGDVTREPRYVDLVTESQTRSELAVPIRRGDRVIGVLDIQSSRVSAFTESDLATQQTIADQLSSAIENARLYDETRRRAERLSLVNRISAAVGAVLDVNDLLETVFREVTPIFEADAFFIALYDGRTDVLDFRIQVDEGMREPPVREPLGTGLTSRVVTERKPLLVNELARERPDGARPTAWGTGKMPSSWIGVPLLLGERIVGVMSVQTYRHHLYDADDLLLAATIGDQLAVALENARLYEEARLELEVRQRTEKVLRESEEKFRNLAEQSPNMIFIHGKGRVLYANRQCEHVTGYTRDEFYAPGFDFNSLTVPDDESAVAENFRRHLAGEEVPPYEYALLTQKGRRVEAILTSKLIRYDGEPAILGIITDITTRKRTERLLQSLNAAALAMEQALTPSELFPAATRVLCTLGLDSAVFLTAEEGERRRLRACCSASGASGNVTLTDAGPYFGFDEVPAVADALDSRTAVFTALTPAAINMMCGQAGGTPWPGRSGGSHIAILAPLSVGEDLFGLLVVSSDDLGPEDVQVFTAIAHQAAAAWRKTRLMRDLEGSLQQLQETQEQLLHAQKMEAIGRLAGGIAHDFNNILTVISGYTSILIDALEGNASVLADLNQIRNTIKRAAALTSRLLAFSRKQIIQPTVLDLNKVVANSVTLLRPLIGEDVDLVVCLAPVALSVRADHYQMEQVLMNLAVNARDAMPEGGRLILETAGLEKNDDGEVRCVRREDPLQRADPQRGASQPSEAPYGAAPSDDTRCVELLPPADLPAGEWVLLRVQDTGVGMSEDTRAHIFEPFFTTKDEGKGSGLGLSTVYGIVTQSGGRLRVESALGSGSTFTVCIPRVKTAGTAAFLEERAPSARGGSGTVLLVEDEKDVRELARRVLEKGGYRVIPVSSAREALLVAEGSAVIDMVVTDVVMPGGMSGVEMGERLSRSRPTLPVLYVSGYTDEPRIHGRNTAESLPFLGKPFQPSQLLARVAEMLKKR
jgi:PAS domain S-box-containing protein